MKKRRDTWVAGLTLFAMFLGAGNIIFPPFIGVQAGSGWLLAALGFLLTAAGFPMLSALAVVNHGGKPDQLSSRFSLRFGKTLNAVILLMIGPLFAIPRTAATTFELSVQPFLPPDANAAVWVAVSSLVFFAVTYLLSVREGRFMDAIGCVLTPMLVLLLLSTIALSVFNPMGRPAAPLLEENLIGYGFKGGYQTMDGIGALVLSGTITALLAAKGHDPVQSGGMLRRVVLIAGLLLSGVYLGYIWIGASGSALLGGLGTRAQILTASMGHLAGFPGQILLALVILFACLTTSAGLTVTFAQYFDQLTRGRLGYRSWVRIAVGVSFGISLLGVERIIALAEPVLAFAYPLCIVLVALGLLGRFVKSDGAFKGTMVGALLFSLLSLVQTLWPGLPWAALAVHWLPLNSFGFGFLLPSVLGGLVGWLVGPKASPLPHTAQHSKRTQGQRGFSSTLGREKQA